VREVGRSSEKFGNTVPAIGFTRIRWSLRATALSGLSPPPDPFPPRA